MSGKFPIPIVLNTRLLHLPSSEEISLFRMIGNIKRLSRFTWKPLPCSIHQSWTIMSRTGRILIKLPFFCLYNKTCLNQTPKPYNGHSLRSSFWNAAKNLSRKWSSIAYCSKQKLNIAFPTVILVASSGIQYLTMLEEEIVDSDWFIQVIWIKSWLAERNS